MKIFAFFALIVATLAPAASRAAKTPPLEVALRNTEGLKIGTATITAAAKGVVVHLEVEGLSPGEHAVHFHEKGECKGPGFKSAGGHLAVGKQQHGFVHPQGPHAGDMRNFEVGADGKARVDLSAGRVTLGQSATSLRRPGGSALVIHAKADDYRSQPAGDSGDRVACAEIR